MPRRTDTRDRVLELARRDPSLGVSAIARELGISEAAVRQHLRWSGVALPGQRKARRRYPLVRAEVVEPNAPVHQSPGGGASTEVPVPPHSTSGRPGGSPFATASRRILRTYDLVGRILAGPLARDPMTERNVRTCGLQVLWDGIMKARQPGERFAYVQAAFGLMDDEMLADADITGPMVAIAFEDKFRALQTFVEGLSRNFGGSSTPASGPAPSTRQGGGEDEQRHG